MSLSPGPFFTCFILSLFLIIYLHVVLHHSSSFFEHGTWFVILGILIVFIRMAIPVNFPFTYTLYSYKLLPPIFDIFTKTFFKNYTIAELLIFIWIAGTVFQIIRLIIKQIKIKQYVSNFYVSNDNDYSYLFDMIREQYNKQIKIAIVPHAISPCITGILRPTLVLPNIDDYSDEELKYICIHEIGHLKNHHLWMTLLVEIVCCIQWWNILIYYMRNEYSLFLELSNDSFLRKTELSFNPLNYASLLIKVSKNAVKSKDIPISDSLCFITNRHSAINLRVSFITNDTSSFNRNARNNFYTFIHFVIISCTIILSVIFVPEASFYTPEFFIEPGTDIDGNNAYFTHNKDGYTLHLNGESSFFGKEIPEDMMSIPVIEEGEENK